jgi:hypothetical protein
MMPLKSSFKPTNKIQLLITFTSDEVMANLRTFHGAKVTMMMDSALSSIGSLSALKNLQGAINYLLETAFIECITRPTLPTPPEPSWPTSRAHVIEQPGKWEGLV